ncbi:MAG: VCBS repeat-containing protein [Rhodothermales bacterium]|nr:VCBS repeat-containing protein [Rhodothermales bacterium]
MKPAVLSLLLLAGCHPGAAPIAAQSIFGAFEDDYGSRYVISETEWLHEGYARYLIQEVNTEEQYVIARNHDDNPSGGGLWSRIDWMQLEGMPPYEWAYCLTAFEAGSKQEAQSTPAANRATPRTGCGGHPFSRMKPALPGRLMTIAGLSFIQSEFRAGAGEAELAISDLDGDGRPEVVVTSSSDETITVLRGSGYGNLSAGDPHPAGERPTHLLVHDLDGDGSQEILIANHETDYLTLLSEAGESWVPSRLEAPVGPHPHFVVATDLNQDGHLDILVDDRQAEGVLVLEGDGSLLFREKGRVDMGGDPYLGFVVTDINGDGRPDVITPNPDVVGLAFGRGDGRFGSPTTYDTGFAPSAVAACDMNGDSHPDLITASGEGGREVAIALNDGSGAFLSHFEHSTVRGLKKLATGDVNADGHCDVLVVSWNGGTTLLLGGPEGIESAPVSVDGNPWGIAMGDLNGDGLDDLLIADGQTDRIQLYLSQSR